MRTLTIALCSIATVDAFSASCAKTAHGVVMGIARANVCAVAPLPPPGFVWADEMDADATVQETDTVGSSSSSSSSGSSSLNSESLEGVVTPIAQEQKVPEPQPKESEQQPKKKPKNVVSSQGLFAPLVLGAKRVMGEQELKELRAKIIQKHSKVIAEFVDTSESRFGQLVLRRMFERADKDGNGTLDKEEVRAALHDLGFDFVDGKQLDSIMKKADKDKNEVIDFEEFVKETPKVLRVNLVKLAKQNGHDLGFLV